MTNEVQITVIVPNYNKCQYIEECLSSIQNQTYKDFECIIIDDGSTDDSSTIISKFLADTRFKVFYNENHGIAFSRNFGIMHANGKYILPVDSDDYIDLTYIERAMSFFTKFPNYTLYYGKWKFIGYNAEQMNQQLGNLHYVNYETLLKGNSIHCSCFYKKEDVIKCGLFDENIKAFEDWELLIRLLAIDKLVYYDSNISLYYRQDQTSRSSYGNTHYTEIYNYIISKNLNIYRQVIYGN